MKALVAEIHKTHIIVITENGEFIKVKRRTRCQIGDTIELKPRSAIGGLHRKYSALAASLIIGMMLISGAYAYYTPMSYISMDINPSMDLVLNRFDRIINVKPLNAEGEKILRQSKHLRNEGLEQGIQYILNCATDSGYLKQNEVNSILFVVSTKDTKQESTLIKRLDTTSKAALSKLSGNYHVILEKTPVKDHQTAVAQNISPGKKVLADKVKAVKPDMTEEKVKAMSVQQAVSIIEEGETDSEAAVSDDKNEKNSGSGQEKGENDSKDEKNGNPSDKNSDKGSGNGNAEVNKNSTNKNSDKKEEDVKKTEPPKKQGTEYANNPPVDIKEREKGKGYTGGSERAAEKGPGADKDGKKEK